MTRWATSSSPESFKSTSWVKVSNINNTFAEQVFIIKHYKSNTNFESGGVCLTCEMVELLAFVWLCENRDLAQDNVAQQHTSFCRRNLRLLLFTLPSTTVILNIYLNIIVSCTLILFKTEWVILRLALWTIYHLTVHVHSGNSRCGRLWSDWNWD